MTGILIGQRNDEEVVTDTTGQEEERWEMQASRETGCKAQYVSRRVRDTDMHLTFWGVASLTCKMGLTKSFSQG